MIVVDVGFMIGDFCGNGWCYRNGFCFCVEYNEVVFKVIYFFEGVSYGFLYDYVGFEI